MNRLEITWVINKRYISALPITNSASIPMPIHHECHAMITTKHSISMRRLTTEPRLATARLGVSTEGREVASRIERRAHRRIFEVADPRGGHRRDHHSFP